VSTIYPLTQISYFIHCNLDSKFRVLGIFLDFKKAFDSVNHDFLINKLHFCGIRSNVLNLIKMFISGRRQQVRLNGL